MIALNSLRIFFTNLLVNMSYLTWYFIIPSPSLGWLFSNMVLPRFVSMWQGMFGRNMIVDNCYWLLNDGFGTMGASSLLCIQSILLPYRPHYVNSRPSQPRTSSWRQSLVILPRSRVSVIRQLSWAGHRFASSFRRPGRARTATCSILIRPGRANHRRPPFLFFRGSWIAGIDWLLSCLRV